jgi:glycosyltransferase involved in cell wall biosynthesis
LKKVLINASALTNNYYNRGVGNYTHSLLINLLNDRNYFWQIVAYGTKDEFIHRLGFSSTTEIPVEFEFYSLGTPGKLLEKLSAQAWYRLKLAPIIKKAAPDLYFTTDFSSGLPKNVPSIVALHDVIPYKTGVYSRKSKFTNNIKRASYLWALDRAKAATKILTISEFSKQELISIGIPAEKIAVTHLALNQSYEEEVAKLGTEINDEGLKRRILNSYNITEPYIFYLGGLESNKNVPQVLTSFSKLIRSYPDLKLVIGGGEFKLGWDHKATPLNERALEIKTLAEELKISHLVIFTGFIQTKDLPVIYKYAKAFVHLSKYEGFGLNVLEPQAVGTPVVAADASCYPEVLADSAVLVDPDNSELIANALKRFLGEDENSRKLATEYAQKGKANLARFNWQRTSSETLAAIGNTLQEVETQRLEKKNRNKKREAIDKAPKSMEVEKNAETVLKEVAAEQKPDQKNVVVLATYFFPFTGGMEKVAFDYAKFLASNGYKVNVITSDRKANKVVIQKQEDYEGLHIIRLKRSGDNYYLYRLKGLLSILKELKPEVILTHGFGFLGHDFILIAYKLWAKRKKVPLKIINTPHGPFMSKKEKGLRQIVKLALTFIQKLYLNKLLNYVIAVNPRQESWITKDYGIKKQKIKVFPPVIAQSEKSFEEILKKKTNSTDIYITSISRLQHYKGFEDIIAAFNDINSAITTKLIIAGATEDEAYMKQLRKVVSFSPRKEDITFEADITNEQRDSYLEKSDIFILASEWEAFGIVIAEAMAAGNAIISTNTEGGRFLVQAGKNGELVEYGSFRDLVAALNKLITDEKLLRTYQQESYNMAKLMDPKLLEQKFVQFIANI